MRRRLLIAVVLAVLASLLAIPALAEAGSAERTPISGQIELVTMIAGDQRFTPGGIIHESGAVSVTTFTDDIAGTVTFYYKRVHISADGSHLVSKGPFAGEVTWQGRTGLMEGMFTTECKSVAGPFTFACDGTMIGHGSGDLEGVQFQIVWGSGWFPFAYEGFALDSNAG